MTANSSARHSASEFSYEGTVLEHMLFTVESGSDPEVRYLVTHHTGTCEATCNCPAATKGRYSCWHLDLVTQAAGIQMARMADLWRNAESASARLTTERNANNLGILTQRVLQGLHGGFAEFTETDVAYMIASRRAHKSNREAL